MEFKQTIEELRNEFNAVMKDENSTADQQQAALTAYMEGISEEKAEQVRAEYEELKNVTDTTVLAARGVHTLTSQEVKYYNEVKKNESFNTDYLMPETIIERVFEGIVEERPLLSVVNFLPYTGKNKTIRGRRLGKAVWGALHRDLEGQLDAAFGTTSNTIHNLTAYFIISNDTLDLGPVWVDRFVRLCLQEATAEALEEAVVKGTGKDQPIGLMKDLDAPVTGGVYADKASAGTLTFKDPTTMISEFTQVLKAFSKYTHKIGDDDEGVEKFRNVEGKIKLLINPEDYYEITGRAMTMNINGSYVKSLPHIELGNIIQSVFVPKGKLVAFLPEDYDASISHDNRIYVYKETLAMSRATLYAVDMFADGKPINNEAARVYDLDFTAKPETPSEGE